MTATPRQIDYITSLQARLDEGFTLPLDTFETYTKYLDSIGRATSLSWFLRKGSRLHPDPCAEFPRPNVDDCADEKARQAVIDGWIARVEQAMYASELDRREYLRTDPTTLTKAEASKLIDALLGR